MCRLADDKDLKQHFVFAKASLEHAEVKEWVKAEGIRGIPHLSIYDGTGGVCLMCQSRPSRTPWMLFQGQPFAVSGTSI